MYLLNEELEKIPKLSFEKTFDKNLTFYVHPECKCSRTQIKEIYKTVSDYKKADYIVLNKDYKLKQDWHNYVKLNNGNFADVYDNYALYNKLEKYKQILNYTEYIDFLSYECIELQNFLKPLASLQYLEIDEALKTIEDHFNSNTEESRKIGMSLLCKCKITKTNILHYIKLLSTHYNKINRHPYFKSVDFQSFLKILKGISGFDTALINSYQYTYHIDKETDSVLRYTKTLSEEQKPEYTKLWNEELYKYVSSINPDMDIKQINIEYEFKDTGE